MQKHKAVDPGVQQQIDKALETLFELIINNHDDIGMVLEKVNAFSTQRLIEIRANKLERAEIARVEADEIEKIAQQFSLKM